MTLDKVGQGGLTSSQHPGQSLRTVIQADEPFVTFRPVMRDAHAVNWTALAAVEGPLN